MQSDHRLLALDVGTKRIGVAVAGVYSKIARPFTTLANDDTFLAKLQQIISDENVTQVVSGLPQNNSGSDTLQTKIVRDFVDYLEKQLSIKIDFQDEGLSSMAAEDLLKIKKPNYTKSDIDAWSAMIILDDYIAERGL